jgi:hypothetical protein
MPDVPEKRCTNCNIRYPATKAYFHALKNGRYGVHSRCKWCVADYHREWYEENKERAIEYQNQYRKNNPDYHRQYRKRKSNEE